MRSVAFTVSICSLWIILPFCKESGQENRSFPTLKVEIVDSVNYVKEYFIRNGWEYPFHIVHKPGKSIDNMLEIQAIEVLSKQFKNDHFGGYIFISEKKYHTAGKNYFSIQVDRFRVNIDKQETAPENCQLIDSGRIVENKNVAIFTIEDGEPRFKEWGK